MGHATARNGIVFRQVLVPIDLADPDLATPSIETAVTLVRASGGSVRLLNVLPVTPLMLAEFVPADFDDQQRQTAMEALDIVAKECGLDPRHVSVTVRQGGVYHEIIEEATAIAADLIVMSSHRPGRRSYFLGSNAAHVVRYATCSVLVVRR
jgi:nucleotide-binding universal stress UspA family protein